MLEIYFNNSYFCSETETKISTAAVTVHRNGVVGGGTIDATTADPLVCSRQPRTMVSNTSLG